MLPHGLQKTFGWFGGYGFTGTMGFFTSIGIPAFLAFLAIARRVGRRRRPHHRLHHAHRRLRHRRDHAVASFMHKANGFFMNWSGQQKGEGIEYHILGVAIAVVLMIGGAGRFSVDRSIANASK